MDSFAGLRRAYQTETWRLGRVWKGTPLLSRKFLEVVMSKKTLVHWLALKVVVAACDRKYQIIDTCWVYHDVYTSLSHRLVKFMNMSSSYFALSTRSNSFQSNRISLLEASLRLFPPKAHEFIHKYLTHYNLCLPHFFRLATCSSFRSVFYQKIIP